MSKLETPRIENGKALLVIGLQQQYNMKTAESIPQLWERFAPMIPKVAGPGPCVAYGVVSDVKKDSDNFSYMAGVGVSDTSKAAGELSRINIPAQKYAIFPHRDHVSKIKDTIDAIWSQWLPKSGHVPADNPTANMIERYGEGFNPQTGMGDMEIWLAIKQ
jgi:AraC family transcriptional regulator